MAVSSRHLACHGPTFGALGRAALASLLSGSGKGTAPETPGPWIHGTASSPPEALVRDFVRNAGGEPSHYRGVVPPHLFPQWTFSLSSRLFASTSYPLVRILNAGCVMEPRSPLPAGEPLVLRARLESIEDDGARALISVRVITGTRGSPDALETILSGYVPLARRDREARKPRPTVPLDAKELSFFYLSAGAGLDFAKLTGDLNPIHWVPAYARVSGFSSCILHGFAMFARAVEALNRGRFSGDLGRLERIEARFVRPLPLPRSAGVYLAEPGRIYLGDAPGGGIYLDGHFSAHGSLS